MAVRHTSTATSAGLITTRKTEKQENLLRKSALHRIPQERGLVHNDMNECEGEKATGHEPAGSRISLPNCTPGTDLHLHSLS